MLALGAGLGPAWFAIDLDSLLIRNRINQWFGNEWFTIHLPLIFYSIWFLIRRRIMIREWIVIRDESQSNRIKWIKSNWIANQNESQRWVHFESDWKLIRIKNKMIRLSESQNESKWIDSIRALLRWGKGYNENCHENRFLTISSSIEENFIYKQNDIWEFKSIT